MTRILITGMSGTGKSSVVERLAYLGFKAIDADQPEWSHRAPTRVPGSPPDTAPVLDWVWREDRMRTLLDESDAGPLFVSGCAPNQGQFYERFDHIVLLSARADVLLDRIATRTTNQFGKSAEERGKILADLRDFEPMLRAGSTIEIDTGTMPLDDVVAAFIELGTGGFPAKQL